MSNTAANFSKTVRTGGDGPSGMGTITAGVPAGKLVRGFLIVTDGQLDFVTVDGQTITTATGTWATNVQHALWITSITNTTTAVGWLFW